MKASNVVQQPLDVTLAFEPPPRIHDVIQTQCYQFNEFIVHKNLQVCNIFRYFILDWFLLDLIFDIS